MTYNLVFELVVKDAISPWAYKRGNTVVDPGDRTVLEWDSTKIIMNLLKFLIVYYFIFKTFTVSVTIVFNLHRTDFLGPVTRTRNITFKMISIIFVYFCENILNIVAFIYDSLISMLTWTMHGFTVYILTCTVIKYLLIYYSSWIIWFETDKQAAMFSSVSSRRP